MSLTLLPSLCTLVPAALGLSIANVASDYYKQDSTTSQCLDLAQTVTACLIGLSIVGPTATACVGFGALLATHTACKVLRRYHHSTASSNNSKYNVDLTQHDCHMIQYRKFRKFDQYLSLFATAVNISGYYKFGALMGGGIPMGFHRVTALRCLMGGLAGLCALPKIDRALFTK